MVEKRTVKTVDDILQYIDEIIKKQGISRATVEEKTYTSAGIISRWIKGKSMPGMDRILDILNFMHIEMTLQFDSENKVEDKKCPKFLDHADVILDSELLEQKIKERLNYNLEGETAKLLKDVLFSNNITLEDKKKIHKMLEILIVAEEMKEM